MSTTPNYPARQTDLAQVYASARRLIEYACALDVIVTIDLVPQRPLAMGNYAAAIKVWARKESEVVRSLGVPEGAPLEAWGFPIVPDRSLSGTEMRALCADSKPGPIQVMDESIGHISIPSGLHPDTAQLVQRFASALAMKLSHAERKYGYSNHWKNPDWTDKCRADLLEHLAKGDPRDVAAYCAFLWHHGGKTSAPAPVASQLVPGVVHCARCKFRLHRTNLYVNSGTTGPGDSSTEPCPNGCGPLWPVTWEQEAREAYKTAENMFDRWKTAEAVLEATKASRCTRPEGCVCGDELMLPVRQMCRHWQKTEGQA